MDFAHFVQKEAVFGHFCAKGGCGWPNWACSSGFWAWPGLSLGPGLKNPKKGGFGGKNRSKMAILADFGDFPGVPPGNRENAHFLIGIF